MNIFAYTMDGAYKFRNASNLKTILIDSSYTYVGGKIMVDDKDKKVKKPNYILSNLRL